MKRIAIVALLAVSMSGCSAGSDTTVNPPPAGNAAASLTIVSGDGQTGAPGSALPVHPAVIVRDASGNPLVGVTVTFAVDSGGGSLSASSATSGSEGIATAGVWALGSGSGTNVLSARTSTLAAIRFHAQAFGTNARPIFTAATVGAGGGTLTYNKPGDALNGLTITVPTDAYPIATQWSVTADSTISVPAAAGFTQVGPALVVGNGQGYADSIITLTVPLKLDAGDIVAPFYFDPGSGMLEPVTAVDQTDTSATLAAYHFSRDLMALPQNGPSATALRSNLHAAFGTIVIVWVKSKPADLVGTWTSSFLPGRDDWEFNNIGEFISPGGDCEGMTLTALYYRYFISNQGRPTLYHHFDKSLANIYDNVNGLRFAGSVQGDLDLALTRHISQVRILQNFAENHNHAVASQLSASRIVLTLKRTGQPILISLYGQDVAGAPFGHSVVAFAATSSGNTVTVSFADPNVHGTARQMVFIGGALQPFPVSTSVTAPAELVTEAYPLSVTAELPLTQINARWSEFLAKTSGSDRYPSNYTFEVYDTLNSVWRPLGDTVRTTINVLRTRVRCSDCPARVPGADPADLQLSRIYNDSATVRLADYNQDVLLSPGAIGYVMLVNAANPRVDPGLNLTFLDSRSFTVKYAPFTIFPRDAGGRTNTPITFAAINGGLMTPGSTFTWDFGDGTPTRTLTGDSLVTHTFTKDSIFTISVEFKDASGVLLGRYSTSSATSQEVGWRFVTAASPTVSLPSEGIGALHADSNARDSVNAWLGRLHSNPERNLIFLEDSAQCRGVGLEQFPGATVDTGLVSSRIILPLGVSGAGCYNADVFTGVVTFGTLGSGTLISSVTANRLDAVQVLGGVSATMTGLTLTGTITVKVTYTPGIGTYTLPFVATQILPKPGGP